MPTSMGRGKYLVDLVVGPAGHGKAHPRVHVHSDLHDIYADRLLYSTGSYGGTA